MRIVLFAAAALAVATVASPDAVRSALATSASVLFESTPFVLAGVLLARVFRQHDRVLAYLGCGCGTGPSARSLPAAAATWLVFGPFVALGRLAAAIGVAFVLHRGGNVHRCRGSHETVPQLLDELSAVLSAALLAGAATQLMAHFDPQHASPLAQLLAGTLFGFTAAPCGLGAVAVAGALHVRAPLAATAFLCIAGILDLRALRRHNTHREPGHDALAYTLLSLALGIVAWRHGDTLVHPAIAAALAFCAVAAALYALRHRTRQSAGTRVAPALMLLGALVSAPPPQYRATETTLTDLFPGEHLTFTGVLSRDGHDAALVRYAITCCRADAAPVAVRLERAPDAPTGTWLRADGTIVSAGEELRLRPNAVERIAPPSDPFIYR